MPDWLAMLHSTAIFALLATAAIGVGAPIARLLKLPTTDRVSRLVWEASLGLIAVAVILGWLGLAGFLRRDAIVLATWIAALCGVIRVGMLSAQSTLSEPRIREAVAEPPAWLGYSLTTCAALSLTAAYFSALAPPTAGDALVYHLELPKRFLDAGELTFDPDDENNVYPLVAEMGFLWALAFNDAAATSLVHWGCGLLLVGATYLLAQPHLGSGWARVAASCTALTPGVNNQMTAPMNDAALALFAVLAVAAWLQARRDGTVRDFILVGLMLGGAIGVKYTGLLFAAALGAAWIAAAAGDVGRRRRLLLGAAVTLLATTLTSGLWYGRAAWYRGDPLYPFLTRQADATGPEAFPEKKTPLGRGPTAIVAAPWSMTMEPARFGGRGHQLGPLFLMFIPVAVACRSATMIATPLWVAALYGGGCLILRQNVRFLLPIVPILAVAVAAIWREMRGWPAAPRRLIVAATAGIVLLLTFIPIGRLRHTAAATFGPETFTDYLQRNEPTFAVAEWINEHLPAESRILSQEQRAFYFAPALTRESLYRRRTQYPQMAKNAAAVWPRLKADGFSHLLTAESTGSPGGGYDVTLSLLADAATAADSPAAPTVVRQWLHTDVDGVARRYRLWELR